METAIPHHEDTLTALDALTKRHPELDRNSILTALAMLWSATTVIESVEAHFRSYGLSQGRFVILLLLLMRPKITWTPALLAKKAQVSRATVTGLLDGLEKSGWIIRRQHPADRRKLIIKLTESGSRHINTMLPDHFLRLHNALLSITNTEHTMLRTLLNKVTNQFIALRKQDGELDQAPASPEQSRSEQPKSNL